MELESFTHIIARLYCCAPRLPQDAKSYTSDYNGHRWFWAISRTIQMER